MLELLAALAFAAIYDAEYVTNYDADTWTMRLTVPVEYEAITPEWVDKVDVRVTLTARVEERIRIGGIDTPEIRGGCEREKVLARAARDETRAMALAAETIHVQLDKREKYGRGLGDVILDGKRMSDWLLVKGYAVVYDGGKRQSWCD